MYPITKALGKKRFSSHCHPNSSKLPFAIRHHKSRSETEDDGGGAEPSRKANQCAREDETAVRPSIRRHAARGFPPFLQRVGTKKSNKVIQQDCHTVSHVVCLSKFRQGTPLGGGADTHTSGARRHMSICLLRRRGGKGRTKRTNLHFPCRCGARRADRRRDTLLRLRNHKFLLSSMVIFYGQDNPIACSVTSERIHAFIPLSLSEMLLH